MTNPRLLTRLTPLPLVVALAASPSPVRAQPRDRGAPPDAAAVERWLRRACGAGQAPDAAWAAAHMRVPVAVDECSGESRRRCRHRAERNAEAAVQLACAINVVGALQRGADYARWSDLTDEHHFLTRGAQRRVVAELGQYTRTLVLVATADHEATLVGIDDR